MPIEADYNEDEQFGKNPENDFFGKAFESGMKKPETMGTEESFEKNPINDIRGSFHDNTLGILDGKHASMDELKGTGGFGIEMPPPEADLSQPGPEGAIAGMGVFPEMGGMDEKQPPAPATTGPGSQAPDEGFGDYNTLEK